MKDETKGRLRRLRHPLTLYLSVFPVLMILSGLLKLPPLCPAAAALMLAAAAVACFAVPGKFRVALGIALMAILAVPLWLLNGWMAALLAAAAAILLLISLPMAAWPRERSLNSAWLICGLVGYAVVQTVSALPISQAESSFQSYRPLNTAAFLLFLAVLLWYLNSDALTAAAHQKHQAPENVRRRNRLLTALLFGLVLLISLIPQVIQALTDLANLALDLLRRAVRFLISLLPEAREAGAGAGGGGMGGMMDLGEATEPSAIAVFLEKALMVLTAAFMIALVCFALYKIGKALRVRIRQLMALLASRYQAATEDYVDEIANTRDGEAEISRRLSLRRKRKRRPADARERLRYAYERVLRRHPEWAAGATARETLEEDAAGLYEQARYSEHPVTEEDAERFESMVNGR
ncbi:MAG: hypothetical protein IKP40_00820 [Clostridia bacterium]|nr:hypothetical protein [Clostridia bacterium]